MKSSTLLLAGLALLPAGLRAAHTDFVVINATASKAYTQKKFVNGVPQPQTYAFFEGKYLGGTTNDRSISHASFLDIAKILAPNLAKQNFYPARDPRTADLVIVVNWGTTITNPYGGKNDMETQFQLQQEMSDVKSYNSAASGGGGSALGAAAAVDADMSVDQTDGMAATSYTQSNADLLGYTNSLNKEMAMASVSLNGLNAEAESHMADLIEERYFIIMLAYDYQKMVADRKAAELSAPTTRKARLSAGQDAPAPPDQPKPVWEVRMNIRADGNNFAEALPAMSKIAADYFGKQEDDLKSQQTVVGKNGRVEIGPLKVIDVAKP
jgi:hypothetical protein